MEYLGSKRAMLDKILGGIAASLPHGAHVVDLFCGTGVVAGALRRARYRVSANDHLALCAELATAALCTGSLNIMEALRSELPKTSGHTRPSGSDGYDRALSHLNSLPAASGFIRRAYSPESIGHYGVERKYLTAENAGKIDAIRWQIEEWRDLLSPGEHALLIRDLVEATTRVSNTAGTYGCFLSQFKARALQPLALAPTESVAPMGSIEDNRVYCGDAVDALDQIGKCDAVYADPPYTKRQYAAYYHLLETIVVGDEPVVAGVTGLRPWHERSSDFCYRRLAPEALRKIVDRAHCREFFLSYSSEGHIQHDEIMDTLGAQGPVSYVEWDQRRYASGSLGKDGRPVHVVERIYRLSKNLIPRREVDALETAVRA